MKPRPSVTAQTRLFALLGNPVGHSLSPIVQNAAMRSAGIDAVYVAVRCNAADLRGVLTGLAHAGGGGNVTIPHKGSAAAIVDAPSARVRATAACNTFWSRRGRIYGENTDVAAFGEALRLVVPEVAGSRALIVGAGGAARAAVYSLLEQKCAAITVLGRSRARAREIVRVAGRRGRRVTFTTEPATLRREGFDVVINATPRGMRATDPLPFRFQSVAGLTAVFDMVYSRGGTAWTKYARSFGVPAVDGSEMLLRQAAAAFELWFETDAPVEAMRKAFRRLTTDL